MLWKVPFSVKTTIGTFYKRKMLRKSNSYLQSISYLKSEHKVVTYELVTNCM